MLAFFDTSLPILIQTDASQSDVGAVLLQEGRPVDFSSAAMKRSELNYAVIEKELLAILLACKKFEYSSDIRTSRGNNRDGSSTSDQHL